MKKPLIQPSTALCVSSHTAVADCVRLMRGRQVGSLLVMNPSKMDQLLGIFTERDLLEWVDEIQQGGHWDKPVAHLMSRPVITFPAENLKEDLVAAGTLMIHKGIRHLPIVVGSRILGVVSMRDLFARTVQEESLRKSVKKLSRVRKKRTLFLHDGSSIRTFEAKSLGGLIGHHPVNHPLAKAPEGISKDLKSEIEASDLVVFDLDGIPPSVWSLYLREYNRLKEAPPLFILLTESGQPQQAVKTLQTLSKGGAWKAFAKPLSLLQFMNAVEQS